MARSWKYWSYQLGLIACLSAGATVVEASIADLWSRSSVLAQVTPDGTLNTTVNAAGNRFTITNGTARGNNLFHSFGQFSIPRGGSATFDLLNAPNITTIFSRVTGGSTSNINGLIQTISSNNRASLFLMNPSGIIFGPNARLDIRGSFIATTANGVEFSNQGFFSLASNPDDLPLLTVNPSALLFNQIAAQPIINRSTANSTGLTVDRGQSLLLVGGDVRLDKGRLTAPEGRVELGGVAGVGTVGLSVNGSDLRLSFADSAARADISLINGAVVNANGTRGGSIQVHGRAVTLSEGAWMTNSTLGAGTGGDLSVNATESVQLSGTTASGPGGLFTQTFGTGDAGDLTIQTRQLMIRDGAQVSAGTFGDGAGGNLSVFAVESVAVSGFSADGFPSGLFTETVRGTGDAGDLTIQTRQLRLQGGALISAGSPGDGVGGNLSILATELVEVSEFFSNGQFFFPSGLYTSAVGEIGDAGDLTIQTETLIIRNGAEVSAGTRGGGKGGRLTVEALGAVQIIGASPTGRFPSNLSTEAEGGTGSAGDLTIRTGQLVVRDGAEISASTRGEGKGGNLTIDTGKLLLQNGSRIAAATFGTGDGGRLTVEAADSVQLVGVSANNQRSNQLTTQTSGTGTAGDLTLNTKYLMLQDGSQIAAGTTGVGEGGNLTVMASDSVHLSGTRGRFPTGLIVNTQGTGDAGDLSITTKDLLLQNGAQVSASTLSAGDGGRLRVSASDSVQVIGTSVERGFPSGLFANTEGDGDAGELTIQTRRLSIQDGAEVGTSTFGNSEGAGGDLSITASESVEVSGTSALGKVSGLFSQAQGIGDAGNLRIETGQLSVQNSARVSVSGEGTGNAGNLTVGAGSILLDNQGQLRATTAFGEGGNIYLQAQDLVLMRRNSLISAEARNNGNGGNITIDASFIVAVPNENSDIIANAFRGRGGNINITTQGIYGLKFRERLSPLSDINASSEFGVAGVVEINTLEVDPNRGLVALPVEPTTPQVAEGCQTGSRSTSRFVVTGRGGLPPNPGEALSSDAVDVGLVTLNSRAEERSSPAPSLSSTRTNPEKIVEAQGWIVDQSGDVMLIAQAPAATPHRSSQLFANCQASRSNAGD
ncbi:filamentous hemagglutinin N-terminal domain-containing protein [Phormidium sp. FACHB-592]|uniref:Filamentous hemagglutinin N-terminal domain-containing protein n=1 Tax=Stenomitos frigidus AS-A4 TaxID=2933935 RepID=A0ABV0KSI5_9CYAN|nr:filamentous hemagglutinin N-terminal domain-containing protein [Phormidium sp. FACHB-592]MBD2077173.1 filamentous hemagglutinin N-terminal domain-containing protein [Phormidium sp. FACHB-592]